MTIATEPTPDEPIEPTELPEVPQEDAERLVDEPVDDEEDGA